MWTDPIILAICRLFPAKQSIFKPSDGRPESEYERHSAGPFFALFGRSLEMVTGKDVLDLGSGFGSQAIQYAEAGARSALGLEVDDDKVTRSRAFAERKHVTDRTVFVRGFGEALPFEDASFDIVTMDDVLEHVVEPPAVFRECYRVLRPGGAVFASFPPYYCVYGGSHLEGYATRFPAMNLLFSTSALRSAIRILLERQGLPWRVYLRDVPTDKLWNQNGLTIRRMKTELSRIPFQQHVTYIGLRDRRKDSSRKELPTSMFRLFETLGRVPILQEALCSRVALELVRPQVDEATT